MRDLKNNSTQVVLIPAARRTTAFTGSAVDTKGEARKVLVLLNVGYVATGGSLVVKIQGSDDATTWTDLYAFSDATTTTASVVDLTISKRYVRAVSSVKDTSNIDYGAWGIFYNERFRPSKVA